MFAMCKSLGFFAHARLPLFKTRMARCLWFVVRFSHKNGEKGNHARMETPQFFPLGEGLELAQVEQHGDQLVLHVTTISPSALGPLCQQPATHLHSRYRRVVKDLPCAGRQVKLVLYVRKFFCETADCMRKVFAERLPHLVAPWAQMTTRLSEALQTIGLATCGRLGIWRRRTA